MSGLPRTPILALATLAGALATCMVLPSLDARCAMGSDAALTLGACGFAQAPSREVGIFGVVIAGIAVVIFGSIGLHALAHHRVSRTLRHEARAAFVANQAVGFVPGIGAALVAGIRHPRIYCSEDLVTRLNAEELRAVLIHERHHQLAHAPARLVVLSALAPFLGLLRSGSAWLERQQAGIEIAADQHAIRNGVTRATLARAILKLRDTSPSVSLAGFATAGDLRLRALLGEDIGSPESRPGAGTAVVVAAAVAGLCSVLSLL